MVNGRRARSRKVCPPIRRECGPVTKSSKWTENRSGFKSARRGRPYLGPPGGKVVLTVRHRDSEQTQDITIIRDSRVVPPLRFDPIPDQSEMAPFQVCVTVLDNAGQPLPGATVTVQVDPGHSSAHVLFFSTKTQLGGAAGLGAETLSAVTGPDGKATIWVRLANATTPF